MATAILGDTDVGATIDKIRRVEQEADPKTNLSGKFTWKCFMLIMTGSRAACRRVYEHE